MLQQFVRVPHAEALYYTLCMELALYLFLSFLFLKKWNRFSLPIAWGASVILAITGVLVPLLAHRRIPMAALFYFLCFFLGTVVYRNFTGAVSDKSLRLLFSFVAVGTLADVYCNYVLVKKANPDELFTFWAVALPWSVAGAVFLLAYALRAHKFPQAFVWLGTISYSVYLFHPAVARIRASRPRFRPRWLSSSCWPLCFSPRPLLTISSSSLSLASAKKSSAADPTLLLEPQSS